MNWFWRLLAPRVDSAITMRLVTFHRALIARGQIEPISRKSNSICEERYERMANADTPHPSWEALSPFVPTLQTENERLEAANAALLDALEAVMRFRRGEGEFDFSALPIDQLANESHDRWQEVEQRICTTVARAKEAAREAHHRYDRDYGSPYDRGSADRYYGRSFKPHFYMGGTYISPRMGFEDMTGVQVREYRQGYEDQTDEFESIIKDDTDEDWR